MRKSRVMVFDNLMTDLLFFPCRVGNIDEGISKSALITKASDTGRVRVYRERNAHASGGCRVSDRTRDAIFIC